MLAIDGVLSLVGTYNFDSLSDHINSEEFVVVQSEAVAAEMSDYIQKFIESNTVEYRIVDGQLRGPEQLNDPAALRRVRRLEGISRRFRDKL
jgi:phosphatidylserine/phosphatidylglycerophosphate/cardiolipin synthase-like enzyme